MRIRYPAVAGTFYENDPERLRRQVAAMLPTDSQAVRLRPLAVISPHAGLIYSGPVAGAMYARVNLPSRIIVVCPNHTGLGADGAVYSHGAWRTPLGDIEVDPQLAERLIDASPLLQDDVEAHLREHSLEVQLPFLQFLKSGPLRIVPVCLATPSLGETLSVGKAIASVILEMGGDIGLIASTDLNHYENQEITLAKDQKAIDRIVALDAEGLWNTVREERISMCGIIPTTAVLAAVNQLGASRSQLISHATSGAVNGDFSAVVGYASIVIS